MSRPLRIQFEGALYHVTSRGDRREPIFVDDEDRHELLGLIALVCLRFDWACIAYCLMGNHYHLLIETRSANLSRGMRHLNGVYTQRFNRRHERVGHVFQGRFAAVLVSEESHLLATARYVVLNPVRAGLVRSAALWPWSSYAATCQGAGASPWLDTRRVLSALSPRLSDAMRMYREFVDQGCDAGSLWDGLRGQIFLGSPDFAERLRHETPATARVDREIPRDQRLPPGQALPPDPGSRTQRDQAIAAAFATGRYTQKQLGEHFGLHYSQVSRIVARAAQAKHKT
jgi:REP element-mobilizing transposase RayT